MRISRDIKPLSYLSEHAQEIGQAFSEGRADLVITENGQPSFVCMGAERYSSIKENVALLALLHKDESDDGQDFNEAMNDLHAEIFS